jgi:hypothetical protein
MALPRARARVTAVGIRELAAPFATSEPQETARAVENLTVGRKNARLSFCV